jgi:hypothetical protein
VYIKEVDGVRIGVFVGHSEPLESVNFTAISSASTCRRPHSARLWSRRRTTTCCLSGCASTSPPPPAST